MRTRGLIALLLALAASPACAADWTTTMATSRLEFVATFENAAAPGVFRQFDVHVAFDPENPAAGTLDVTIAVKSADMNSRDVNDAIGGPEWFDVAHFPQAEFRATGISRIRASEYLARGALALKGVSRPVDVPFTWAETGDSARMTGAIVVKRGSFGIGTGAWAATDVIGPDVSIKFDVHLHKTG